MAHSCPKCGLMCHCGGDIDDSCLDDDEYAAECTCCPDRKYVEDIMDEVGCLFTGECLMPGKHYIFECVTAEDMEALEKERENSHE